MCRLFDIYFLCNVVVLLCIFLSASPTSANCDEDYFLTNSQLQNNYKVKNTRVEKRESLEYAPHLTHQIACDNGLFKYTTGDYSGFPWKFNKTYYKLLLKCQNGQWIPQESIGVMAACQKYEWLLSPSYVVPIRGLPISSRINPSYMRNANAHTYVEYRVLMGVNENATIDQFTVEFFDDEKQTYHVQFSNASIIDCQFDSTSNNGKDDWRCYSITVDLYFIGRNDKLDKSQELVYQSQTFSYTQDSNFVEFFLKLKYLRGRNEFFGERYNLTIGQLHNHDPYANKALTFFYLTSTRQFSLANVDLLAKNNNVLVRKMAFVNQTKLDELSKYILNDRLECILNHIRMRRFYNIGKCFGDVSYNVTWLENCCDKLLRAYLLDVSRLVNKILLTREFITTTSTTTTSIATTSIPNLSTRSSLETTNLSLKNVSGPTSNPFLGSTTKTPTATDENNSWTFWHVLAIVTVSLVILAFICVACICTIACCCRRNNNDYEEDNTSTVTTTRYQSEPPAHLTCQTPAYEEEDEISNNISPALVRIASAKTVRID